MISICRTSNTVHLRKQIDCTQNTADFDVIDTHACLHLQPAILQNVGCPGHKKTDLSLSLYLSLFEIVVDSTFSLSFFLFFCPLFGPLCVCFGVMAVVPGAASFVPSLHRG